MNRTELEQIAEVVGGRIVAPLGLAGRTVTRVCTDSRQIEPEDLFVAVKGPNFDGHDFVAAAFAAGAAAALLQRAPDPQSLPGDLPVGLIVVRDTVAALGRLAGWYRRHLGATVVAVTGSNGKTTTKAMIAHIMAKDRRVVAAPSSYNNAVGVPLTLLSADPGCDLIVCEIGSNAPGEVSSLGRIAEPDIGVIVSISETHLAGLRSLDGVAVEKASLLDTLAPRGVGIVNGDRPPLLAAARGFGGKLIRFGNDPQSDLVLGELVTTSAGIRFTVNGVDRVSLPLLGRHNAINALAAITVGRRLGLSVADAAGRLADFSLPPMRLERAKLGPIELINDAYNANPDSMAAALDVLIELPRRRGRKVFIAGDMLELGDESEAFHHQLGQRIASAGVQRLIAVGEFAQVVVQGARQAGMDAEETFKFADTDALLKGVADLLAAGDLVLVKGSRRMALERVVEALRERMARSKQ